MTDHNHQAAGEQTLHDVNIWDFIWAQKESKTESLAWFTVGLVAATSKTQWGTGLERSVLRCSTSALVEKKILTPGTKHLGQSRKGLMNLPPKAEFKPAPFDSAVGPLLSRAL